MTTIGIDTAAIDGNAPPDYARAKGEGGASFAYLKVSQHVYPDGYYHRDYAPAKAAGLRVGGYHLPGWGPRAAGAKQQVAAFRAAYGGALERDVDLPPMLDVESGLANGSFKSFGQPLSEIVDFIRQLVLEVEDQLTVTPGMYISYNQYYDLGCPAMAWAARCPCWIKTAYRLAARQPADSVMPMEPHLGHDALHDPRDYHRIPDPFRGWFIEQIQGDAVGFAGHNKTVDVNRFHVTHPGDSGPHVAWMQRKLEILPCPRVGPLNADGYYGHDLELAVRALQHARGLAEDAVVGPATFAAIGWL